MLPSKPQRLRILCLPGNWCKGNTYLVTKCGQDYQYIVAFSLNFLFFYTTAAHHLTSSSLIVFEVSSSHFIVNLPFLKYKGITVS